MTGAICRDKVALFHSDMQKFLLIQVLKLNVKKHRTLSRVSAPSRLIAKNCVPSRKPFRRASGESIALTEVHH